MIALDETVADVNSVNTKHDDFQNFKSHYIWNGVRYDSRYH